MGRHIIDEQIYNEGKRVEAAYMLAKLLCKLEISRMRRQNDPNTMIMMSSMPRSFRNAYMLPIASMSAGREYAVLVPRDEEPNKMDIDLDE